MSVNDPEAILLAEVAGRVQSGQAADYVESWRQVLHLPRKTASKTTGYSALKERTLRAAEPRSATLAAVAATGRPGSRPAQIAQPVKETPPAVTSGYAWVDGAWQRSGPDPIAVARTAALAGGNESYATATQPRAIGLAENDTEPLAQVAHALMKAKRIDYRSALLEASNLEY